MKINGSWDSVLREERLKMNDYLFAELPKAESIEAIEALLPGNLNKDQIKIG
jgi:hypothetical protein